MSIFDIEQKRQDLIYLLQNCSDIKKLLLINSFFEQLLLAENISNSESYFIEFIDEYITVLNSFNGFYIPVEESEKINNTIEQLLRLNFLNDFQEKLTSQKQRLIEKIKVLENILIGKSFAEKLQKKLLFPVIEKSEKQLFGRTIAFLESLTIKISKRQNEDKIIVVPYTGKVDTQLDEQVKDSWETAFNYIKLFAKKTSDAHEIIIVFDNSGANFVGNSLGIALTIGFLEELAVLYNTAYLIKINDNIASTGIIENNKAIRSIGSSIELKVESIFYSPINILIIATDDLKTAQSKLYDLKKEYPNRDLKLVAVNDIDEILNRRDLIVIKKQNPVVRVIKKATQRKKSSGLLLMLSLIIIYFLIRDIDNNPALLDYDNTGIYVKNVAGKVLWKTNSAIDTRFTDLKLGYSELIIDKYAKIVDINEDGKNEIVLTSETNLTEKRGRVVCLDYTGKEIWEYTFKDTISSYMEVLEPDYFINLIDTVTFKNQKVFVMMCNNGPSFSSAVFMLDLKTGKRLEPTLWHSGFVISGIIKGLEQKETPTLICTALNNGYQQSAVFAIELDSLYGCAPSTPGYMFKWRKIAPFHSYILLPNSDYNKTLSIRSNSLYPQIRDDEKNKEFSFYTIENAKEIWGFINYKLQYNLKDFRIVIGSDFRPIRDSLVVKGILQYPLTDTPEYCEILKSQIRYWNGKEFVKRGEL